MHKFLRVRDIKSTISYRYQNILLNSGTVSTFIIILEKKMVSLSLKISFMKQLKNQVSYT